MSVETITPDAFVDVRMLLALIVDAPACKKHVAELERTTTAHNTAAELARKERVEADAKLTELNARQAALDQRETALDERARELDARAEQYASDLYLQAHGDPEEKRRAAVAAAADSINRPSHLRRVGHAGVTMVQEFIDEPRATDPHYGV